MKEIGRVHAALQSKVHDWGRKKPLEDQLIIPQNASLLSKAFLHFSNISNRQCCVPWSFLNPSWNFDRILSKKTLLIVRTKILSKIFETKDKILIGLQFPLKTFYPFLEHSFSLTYAIFKDDGNLDDVIASLKNIWSVPLYSRCFASLSSHIRETSSPGEKTILKLKVFSSRLNYSLGRNITTKNTFNIDMVLFQSMFLSI